MATAGIDYALTGIPSRKTVARLSEELVWCVANADWGLTYQKCRFCGRGWPELKGLFKYAVRHYVCEDCREHYRNSPPSSVRP
jgi:hypothetical protein